LPLVGGGVGEGSAPTTTTTTTMVDAPTPVFGGALDTLAYFFHQTEQNRVANPPQQPTPFSSLGW